MGSYLTGLVVALLVIFGLYVSIEVSAGNPLFGQDKLDSHSSADLLEVAKDFKSEDQLEAILQLGNRPGDLSKTVPVLAKLSIFQNQLIKNAADASLQQIGAPAAEHIRPLLESQTTEGYAMACSALRAIGPGGKMYLPEIKRLLVDDITAHRKCGLYALQGMGEDGKEAMKEIIDCVLDEDLNNQCSACRVLETFGNDAIDAEQSLLQLLEEGGPSTRGWAAVCLGAIGPTSSDVDIAELLASKLTADKTVNPVEQERLLSGLAYLGPEAEKVADVVRQKMNGRNKYVSAYAAYALWRITGDADESLSVLRELLSDPNHVDEAVFLVGKMGPAGLPLLDVVVRGLSSPEPGTREQAVIAIANMGPGAKSVENKLEERLNDSDALVRIAAKRLLAEFNEAKDPKDEETRQPVGK